MKKFERLTQYPVHNPEDESDGMDLVDVNKAREDKEEGKGNAGKASWTSFADYMKQQNETPKSENPDTSKVSNITTDPKKLDSDLEKV